jgi:hypothetical protein
MSSKWYKRDGKKAALNAHVRGRMTMKETPNAMIEKENVDGAVGD